MSEDDTETITVANVSAGQGGADGDTDGDAVELPVVELLTGRSFITGKSGSGKSNTASVLIENLLDNNFPVLIVDVDGEYYGLKEEYELLHAGADDECDIQVSPEHAEKLASLALEQNVPVILDVSGYLDEDVAKELLLRTARQLFAKEKKLKKPFLMLVEECHEYMPEGGGMDETGKMLVKVAKRGRKHGLGIVGISQRPADVKKDYITQCDWLVWHRLTWNNDTKVVGRILGSEYASAVEDLDDGEAFLMTDWSEDIRRVKFHRKQTFDAGATPGLDDFERPELKSVSGNLVSELEDITDERERRESELADLRQQLDKKEKRIEELKAELQEARNLEEMADQFAHAMLKKAEAPYRGGDGRNLARPDEGDELQRELREYERRRERADGDADVDSVAEADDGRAPPETLEADPDAGVDAADGADTDANADDDADDEPDTDFDWHAGPDDVGGGFDAPSADSTLPEDLRERVVELDDVSRGMLRHYRDDGPADVLTAHVAAGGEGDRNRAYARNRRLRLAGLARHAGRGRYAYALPELVAETYAEHLPADRLDELVAEVEDALGIRQSSEGDAGETDAAADTAAHDDGAKPDPDDGWSDIAETAAGDDAGDGSDEAEAEIIEAPPEAPGQWEA